MIKTEKENWLCRGIVKSGRDMREWVRPIQRQFCYKGCFYHIKGLIYSHMAAECTRLPINVITTSFIKPYTIINLLNCNALTSPYHH